MTVDKRTEIESLLEAIEATRQRIYLAQAYGVRRAGLRDVKSEYLETRRRLAEATQ